jgi:organic hydroperoxide reductase OsmC/OhrA
MQDNDTHGPISVSTRARRTDLPAFSAHAKEEGMTEELVFNRCHSVSSGTPGRSINAVRQHYFVVDDPSIGESMTPADHFVSGIAACAANHMEMKAQAAGIPLTKIEVDIEARRLKADTSRFLGIHLDVAFHGIAEAQAQELLASYQSH